MNPLALAATDARYPARLRERLGANAPGHLSALGNLDLLAQPKTALFCSARCPGDAILRAYDQAAKWRDAGRCIISGFHSPVEKECLRNRILSSTESARLGMLIRLNKTHADFLEKFEELNGKLQL